MRKLIFKIWESEKFRVVILALAITSTLLLFRVWELYHPQATIVIHDYGQVFESETDWKIWRLEHNLNY